MTSFEECERLNDAHQKKNFRSSREEVIRYICGPPSLPKKKKSLIIFIIILFYYVHLNKK